MLMEVQSSRLDPFIQQSVTVGYFVAATIVAIQYENTQSLRQAQFLLIKYFIDANRFLSMTESYPHTVLSNSYLHTVLSNSYLPT